MIITKIHKRKIYANDSRNKFLENRLILSCDIYNHCIALHRRYFRLYKKHLGLFDLQKHITKLKKRDKKHWSLLNSQTIQEITERIDLSYKAFFRELKKKNNRKTSTPHFKKHSTYNSFTFKNTGWKLNDNDIVIQGKKFKFNKDRKINGNIRTVTVKRDSLGNFWICVCVKETINPRYSQTSNSVGLDFGLKTFLTTSDNEKIDSPEFLKKDLKILRRKSKNLSSKTKGSHNRIKARLELSKLHESISNKRNDWQWKTAHSLVSKYDVICVEDLNMKAMQKLWGRKIGDLALTDFYQKLEYLCIIENKKFVKIDRFYASSKICNVCSYKLESLPLKQRVWVCPSCNTKHDRDVNASKNIKMVGASTNERVKCKSDSSAVHVCISEPHCL